MCDTDEVYALSVAGKNGGNLCFAQRKAGVFLYFERNIFTVHYKKNKSAAVPLTPQQLINCIQKPFTNSKKWCKI